VCWSPRPPPLSRSILSSHCPALSLSSSSSVLSLSFRALAYLACSFLPFLLLRSLPHPFSQQSSLFLFFSSSLFSSGFLGFSFVSLSPVSVASRSLSVPFYFPSSALWSVSPWFPIPSPLLPAVWLYFLVIIPVATLITISTKLAISSVTQAGGTIHSEIKIKIVQ
jgi:hypothetical protein